GGGADAQAAARAARQGGGADDATGVPRRGVSGGGRAHRCPVRSTGAPFSCRLASALALASSCARRPSNWPPIRYHTKAPIIPATTYGPYSKPVSRRRTSSPRHPRDQKQYQRTESG